MPIPTTDPAALTDTAGIQLVLGVYGVTIRLDWDRTTILSSEESARVGYAINIASQEVFDHLGNHFALAVLTDYWPAYWYASVIAAQRLCVINGGTPTAALQAEYEWIMDRMQKINTGQYTPAGIASLSAGGVGLSNFRIDGRFRNKMLRVQASISDGARVQQSPVRFDIPGLYIDGYQPDR